MNKLKAIWVALTFWGLGATAVEWSRQRPPVANERNVLSFRRVKNRLHRPRFRRDRALVELTHMNDLLQIAIAAGLNLYQGLEEVARNQNGLIAERVHASLRQFDLGLGLPGLFEAMSDGVPLPELRRWGKALAMGHVLGTPIADILAQQAAALRESVRLERRRRTEALPMRLTMIGMIFLFPPAVLVVLLPNLLQFLEMW